MHAPGGPVSVLTSIAPLTAGCEAWFADIWGLLHDGVAPFPQAVAACERFRAAGGIVLLLSNAPRPWQSTAAQLARIGVPASAFDAIVTSGDVARALIGTHTGGAVLHLGPERDLPIFDGLDVKLAGVEAAQVVVCTGLNDDETETPETYAALLAACAGRGLPMICANPDLTVERGGRIVYCAGALAAAYERLGGEVAYAGKPYRPIYDMAFAELERLKGQPIARETVMAIGDGIRTDIEGAVRAGLRSVYVASGVHVEKGEALDARLLAELFPDPARRPVAAMTGLAW